jgi:hypothetical protein
VSTNELLDFTRRALAADIERERIRTALQAAGWPQTRIEASLSHFSVVTDFPIPVPAPPPAFSAREAFVYLLLFSSMSLAIWHLIALCFQIVDYVLPDPADPVTGSLNFVNAVRWNMSVLIVVYPLFALLVFATNRRACDVQQRKLSLARLWLTYIALFSAAIALVGNVTLLVSNIISGGLTAALFAKFALVAAIIGGVFAFYLRLMLEEEYD